MYSIVLTSGKIIDIDAMGVEWHEKTRMITLYVGDSFHPKTIARINMDNVVGWIESSRIKESED